MKKEKFNVQGMTCSACQSHVNKAVEKLDGVKSVNVNLLSNNMVVEYDENKVDNEKIINAVVDAGYGATTIFENEKKQESNRSISNEDVIKSMKKRLMISIFFWIPLMFVAMHHMIFELLNIQVPEFIRNIFDGPENAITFAITQVLLLLPIMYVNRAYFISGFKKLFKRNPNMDSLVAIGSSAAIIYGIYAIYVIGYGLGHGDLELVHRFSMDLYFESAGTILTLITIGKYLETKSKGKTGDAISKLINLAPQTAILLKDNKEIEVNIDEILKEDIVVIKPGASIPIDGVIIEGKSSIDQSSITGESIPVEKEIGDNVVSGTINKNGYLKVRATKVGEDTTLSQIIKLVEEASNSKAPISRLADKVSGVFVPVVISIAVFATIFWLLQGQSFEFALSIGIAVLVISCPCALGLATPVAIMVGTGKGAENGILFKSAESLELLHLVDTVVLDKTGTVTEGKPKVVDIITNQQILQDSKIGNGKIKFVGNINNNIASENNLLKIAASLENNSEHPLADAIIQKAKENKIEFENIDEFLAISGRGVKGKINGINYYGGNLAFMKENNVNTQDYEKNVLTLSNQGKICLYFAKENNLLGVIAVSDTVKNTSKKAIENLKKNKIDVVMITGDNKLVSETIAKEVGIDKVIAEVLPQDKEKEVSKLQENGKKVAFVGDGINDSPALVKADVGLAIGSGTDIAIESADVVLMKNSLIEVDTAISLSKAVIRNIKMNLFWAFFYNIIGIPVAGGLFYLSFGLKLNPMIGAAAMSLSSVCVVTNALRLRYFKNKNISENILKDFKQEEICTTDKCDIKNLELDKIKKVEEEKIMKTISIEGMQCNHCKMTVEKALSSIDGVTNVEVSLENKTAVIETSKEILDNTIKNVIEDSGFTVTEIN